MENYKLKKRGLCNEYHTDLGLIEVYDCTNPNVYVLPGYYLAGSNPQRFARPITAARNEYKRRQKMAMIE